ncbi:NADP-dependent oxidoreductase [Novosphingobium endophyticum]|uniref:NADP-dependent oxidoreductase n=1 Tax=Novosphingobium endophyticum TaxID=1955250 RepID=A0A916TSI2_9SPHN|nr:NADP-dependent oxidoreductase [Novosphingobium endophyticum]GGC02775.1 NADP-dependent oxidoreductase [Novosphingobium endophyticum]
MGKVKHVLLARRPHGVPVPDDFELAETEMPVPGEGEFLVAMRVGSVDPAIRGFLDDRPSYLPPVALGAPVAGMSLGEVVQSNNPKYPAGIFVRAMGTWSDHFVLDENALGLEIVDQKEGTELHHYMGALGPVGLTAWVGLFAVGQVRAGETVVVSAAAGATGSTVGQIAKARGCKVIGLVGSAEKAKVIRDLGFDAAIEYRAAPDIAAGIAKAAPEGVDVYFDNVGGEMLEAILPLMRLHGRVPVCGMIGQYNDADHPYGVKTLWQLVVNRIRMQGFITYDYPDVLDRAQAELEGWVAEGKLKPLANLRDGFEKLPEAFIDLMSGRTIGKTLVRI